MTVQIGNQWDELLKDEWSREYYQNLRRILVEEYRTKTIYPPMHEIFQCLQVTDFPDVKAVILGQDPYHGENQAHGMSFSVKPGNKIPPSLMNIYKELHTDLNLKIPNNGYLMKWAKQGVLLLNTSLTVICHQPNSHEKIGWQLLTDRIIELLGRRDCPVVFILWGNNARKKRDLITNPQHLILESPHPSPFSANRGFFGSRPFSKTNEFLVNHHMQPIDWQIEDIGFSHES